MSKQIFLQRFERERSNVIRPHADGAHTHTRAHTLAHTSRPQIEFIPNQKHFPQHALNLQLARNTICMRVRASTAKDTWKTVEHLKFALIYCRADLGSACIGWHCFIRWLVSSIYFASMFRSYLNCVPYRLGHRSL